MEKRYKISNILPVLFKYFMHFKVANRKKNPKSDDDIIYTIHIKIQMNYWFKYWFILHQT